MSKNQEAQKSFKYVYVPCDINAPIVEKVLSYSKDEEIEVLTKNLQIHFKDSSAPVGNYNRDDHREAIRKQVATQVPSAGSIPNEAIDMLMNMVTVDTVPLILNTKESEFLGVNAYVDDQGSLKGLPVNVRASNICFVAGKEVRIMGDAFFARFFDNDDDFRRLDFTLADLTENSEFFKTARKINEERARKGRGDEDMQFALHASQQKGKPEVTMTKLDPEKCGFGRRPCGNKGEKLCGRCKTAKYCSVECQKADWPIHKKDCQAPAAQ